MSWIGAAHCNTSHADHADWPALLASDELKEAIVEVGLREPLGQFVPTRRIFVRKCYREVQSALWEMFREAKRVTVCLTGTPGIGKSMFGLYFLFQLVRFLLRSGASTARHAMLGLGLNGVIVYEYALNEADSSTFYVIDTTAATIWKTEADVSAWTDDPHSFLIKDGPCKGRPVHCSVLWISLPRAGSFQKAREISKATLYLPPWSPDELVECWKHRCLSVELNDDEASKAVVLSGKEAEDALDSDADEDEKFEAKLRRWVGDLGPVARRLSRPALAHNRLIGALADVGNEDIDALGRIAEGGDPGGEVNKFRHSHRLLLMIPSADYTTYKY